MARIHALVCLRLLHICKPLCKPPPPQLLFFMWCLTSLSLMSSEQHSVYNAWFGVLVHPMDVTSEIKLFWALIISSCSPYDDKYWKKNFTQYSNYVFSLLPLSFSERWPTLSLICPIQKDKRWAREACSSLPPLMCWLLFFSDLDLQFLALSTSLCFIPVAPSLSLSYPLNFSQSPLYAFHYFSLPSCKFVAYFSFVCFLDFVLFHASQLSLVTNEKQVEHEHDWAER